MLFVDLPDADPAATLHNQVIDRLPRRSVALAVSLALAAAAHAQDTQPTDTQTMPKISVGAADEEQTNKIDAISSPKFTQPLLETPQTITIVSKEVLDQQGATSLSQALRNTPGVTFLLGENGRTDTGDSIFMRGFDTQGSIFVDGIRDLGAVTRDTFNTQQVEIAKGPAGPDNGRGAASGYVNMSSKVPLIGSFTAATASYGTSANARVTGDLNHHLEGTGTALRLNVMGQDGKIDGRDFIERQGWAVAPSLALGLEGATRSYFYLLHTEQDNIPDGGVPTIGLDGFYNAAFDVGGSQQGVVPARVDRENFYGSVTDFEQIKGTMFTARIEHDFSADVQLRNTSRYGKLRQFYQVTGVNALEVGDPDPANWTVVRTRQTNQTRFQENTLLTNQTNLTANVTIGGLGHAISGGFEFIDEEQFNPGYQGLGVMPNANLYDPDPRDPLTDHALVRSGAYTRGETRTFGVYLFDTISVGERWEFTAGARLDAYETDFDSAVLSTAESHPLLLVDTLVSVALQSEDELFAYKLGALYKIGETGTVYLSHATSRQPPGGVNFTLSGTATNINSPNLDPQKANNLELGTKWELRDGSLAVSGAIFRSENENDLAQVDPNDPSAVQQIGKRRIEGIEIGIVGKLTDNWEISGGVAKMKTEVIEGTATQTGQQINWSPELTFTSWTTYHTPFGLSFGGGLRYVDTVFRSINSTQATTPTNMRRAPDYWVVDAMVAYDLSDQLTLQLNGYNLADELYVAALNNSGARYSPGTPRSALLTVNYEF